MIRKYAEIFCWKNVGSFCSAKAAHIFSAKKIRLLYIESAKTVNEMTLNELVKLTTLWTTGPRMVVLEFTCCRDRQWIIGLQRLNMHNFLFHGQFCAQLLHSYRRSLKVRQCYYNITKTCLYNFDPLKPHFYIVKLGFTGVYIIFFISAQKHRLWVLVRTASPRPRRF